MDITAIFPYRMANKDTLTVLKMFKSIVKKLGGYQIQLVDCSVPILKFSLKSVEIDLSINGKYPCANSDLIFTYTQIDDRFRTVALFLKSWFKEKKIHGAYEGYFSSYAIYLLIIAYL